MPLILDFLKQETGKELETNFNPDEIVGLGASIHAALISNSHDIKTKDGESVTKKPILETLTSHSLGIIAYDRVLEKKYNSIIIPKGTKRSESLRVEEYSPASDFATSIKIVLLQGEDSNPEFCQIVGSEEGYLLEGITPMKADKVIIEVQLENDNMDLIHVQAKEFYLDDNGNKIPGKGKPIHIQVSTKALDSETFLAERSKVSDLTVK